MLRCMMTERPYIENIDAINARDQIRWNISYIYADSSSYRWYPARCSCVVHFPVSGVDLIAKKRFLLFLCTAHFPRSHPLPNTLDKLHRLNKYVSRFYEILLAAHDHFYGIKHSMEKKYASSISAAKPRPLDLFIRNVLNKRDYGKPF